MTSPSSIVTIMGSWISAPSIGWLAAPASFDAVRGPSRQASLPSVAQPDQRQTESASVDARDAEWIARIAENDIRAFRALFDAYVNTLVRLANGYVRNSDTAQDVVQMVFIALWDRRASLMNTQRVGGYLARATRNQAIKTIRASTRAARWEHEAARNDDIFAPAVFNLADQSLETEDFGVALRAALLQLPVRQREVFLLHREQGLDYATIAAGLGVTVPSVYNTISRAIARLRVLLSDYL